MRLIGIPRAMLYHYYKDLWLRFFDNLKCEVIISPETNKQIVALGNENCIDEACYSSKIYIGHVAWLVNRCDMIFVPRMENTAIKEDFCPRTFGLYDLVRNTFPKSKLLHADTNYLYRKKEQDAYIKIGEQLGKTKEESLAAYTDALDFYRKQKNTAVTEQEELCKADGFKVLVVSHAYNTYDAVIGKSIVDYFDKAGVKVLFAEIIDSAKAKEWLRAKYGPRMYWKINAELIAGVEYYKDYADGIVLISTFPCGPDSIFNEMIIRSEKEKPILNIMIDELDATAGLMTRLESFVDILETRRSL